MLCMCVYLLLDMLSAAEEEGNDSANMSKEGALELLTQVLGELEVAQLQDTNWKVGWLVSCY